MNKLAASSFKNYSAPPSRLEFVTKNSCPSFHSLPTVARYTSQRSFATIPKNRSWNYKENHKWNQRVLNGSLGKTGFGFVALAAIPMMYFGSQTAFAEQKEEKKETDEKTNSVDQDHNKHNEEDKEPDWDIDVKYLIIGSGCAATTAFQYIKLHDPEAKVLMVTEENNLPYLRPPLSKEMWKSEDPKSMKFVNFDGKESEIWLNKEDLYKDSILLNTRAEVLHSQSKRVLLSDKTSKTIVHYDKLLIATGGTPKSLTDNNKVSTYRGLNDFLRLLETTKTAKQIVVVGGGFLGSELSASIAAKAKASGSNLKVIQVFPESGLMALNFPEYLSNYTTDTIKKEYPSNYDIRPERWVKEFTTSADNSKVIIRLDTGEDIEADHAVVAAGIVPNNRVVEHDAAIEIDQLNGGIVVNAELQAIGDVYAAGDVASIYDTTLKQHRRIEHWDHGYQSGLTAARNMVGKNNRRERYDYQPFFWSDVGPIGYEAVGVIDNKYHTVSVWEKPSDDTPPSFKKGFVYYVNDKKVVGVLIWGVPNKIDKARQVIGKPVETPDDVKSLIPLEQPLF